MRLFINVKFFRAGPHGQWQQVFGSRKAGRCVQVNQNTRSRMTGMPVFSPARSFVKDVNAVDNWYVCESRGRRNLDVYIASMVSAIAADSCVVNRRHSKHGDQYI